MSALSLSSPVTPASLRAMTEGLDRPHGNQAALGLGTHGRKVRDRAPAAADDALDLQLDRHASARTDTERRLYLEALGNAGAGAGAAGAPRRDRRRGPPARRCGRVQPALRPRTGRRRAALIERALGRSELALAAVRAAAYRDPARWRPLLLAAQERYPENEGLQGEVRAILRRWSV